MNIKQGFIGILILLIIAFIAGYYFAGHKDKINIPDIIPGNASTTKTVSVYFTNTERFAVGTEPYEDKVERKVDINKDDKVAVLEELYKGPNLAERQRHLVFGGQGSTGVTLVFNKTTGVANVYLQGKCDSTGGSYTIYNVISANLKQFKDVKAVRVYDPEGNTLNENPTQSSSPGCLQP